MMRVLSFIGLLSLMIIMPCAAQQLRPGEGMATWYESQEAGLYAAHATFPFGTQLIVTNPKNQKQVVVQVGGRIPADSTWKMALSAEAADVLDMNMAGFTLVNFAEVPKEPKVRSARTVRRIFSQTGPAIAQNARSGSEFTAVHPSLPFGTKIRVTNQKNRQQAEATVTGRIAANKDRIIELSPALARALGIGSGSVMVFIEAVN